MCSALVLKADVTVFVGIFSCAFLGVSLDHSLGVDVRCCDFGQRLLDSLLGRQLGVVLLDCLKLLG